MSSNERTQASAASGASIFAIATVRDVLRLAGRDEPNLRGFLKCPLPGHPDSTPSFHVLPSDHGWTCFGCGKKGGVADLIVALGLVSSSRDAAWWLESKMPEAASRRDEAATVVGLARERAIPEEILREQFGVRDLPNGGGVRIPYPAITGGHGRSRIRKKLYDSATYWDRDGKDTFAYAPPFTLALARKRAEVVIVEGETDTWTLYSQGIGVIGIPGSTLAKCLLKEHLPGIHRAFVVKEPDKGGHAFVIAISERLRALGFTGAVKALNLHGTCGVKDPSELHARDPAAFGEQWARVVAASTDVPPHRASSNGSPSQLSEPEGEPAIGGTSDFVPLEAADEGAESGIVINVTGESLPTLTKLAIAALAARNEPPRIFRRAGSIVRVERNEKGILACNYVTTMVMRHEMARAADWCKTTSGGNVTPTEPRRSIVEDVLATPELPFPELRGIATAPFFAKDGTLVTTPGYSRCARIVLARDEGLAIPEIDRNPDTQTVRAAVDLIDDLISDFPFVVPADRAHAFGLLILPFVRYMIDGPTPLHISESPTRGTGKTKLLEVLLAPGCGLVPVRVLGRDEEETRKNITSILSAGTGAVILDNLTGRVDSSSLAALLTADTWSDRKLGSNALITVDNTLLWTASANNVNLSTDLARRAVAIRIDAGLELPENRTNFRHALPEYAYKNRGLFIAAACTLACSWIAAGKPNSEATPLGSYEKWSTVIGGILAHAGVAGFLGNRERLLETADSETSEWRALVNAWLEKYGLDEVTAAQLLPLAADAGIELGKTDTERAAAIRMGKRLAAQRDRVFDGYRIEMVQKKTTSNRWRLVRVCGDVGDVPPPTYGKNGSGKDTIYRPGGETSPTSPYTPTANGVKNDALKAVDIPPHADIPSWGCRCGE